MYLSNVYAVCIINIAAPPGVIEYDHAYRNTALAATVRSQK